MDNLSDLETLADLKEKGVISEKEFNEQKKALLAANLHGAVGGKGAPKSRLIYILLGLFLGGFGVHNFYAGYKGKGITQLLLTFPGMLLIIPIFIVFIWVIVDLVTVTQDANGVPFKE